MRIDGKVPAAFRTGIWVLLPCLAMIIIWLSACQKEEHSFVSEIHGDFKPMVDSFQMEAYRRGLRIDLTNLIVDYSTDLGETLCGQCNSREPLDKKQKIILINAHLVCWDHAQELEALIFHELGHCILRREHLSDTLPNGDPKSLMIDGDLTVYAPCRYVFGPVDCNNVHKRKYYIDELFDPQVPVPDWAK